MSALVHRARWRAMGCAASVEVVGGDASLVELARASIEHLEGRWTRFEPTSDICRLNAADGAAVGVDPATVVLLEAMAHAHAATGGHFDPTLLVPLVGLGDPAGRQGTSAAVPLPSGLRPRGEVAGVAVDHAASVARLPIGTAVDAGGIGKGLAADMVAASLVADGAAGAMVCIGGDLRVAGLPPTDGGWLIGVVDAFDPDVDVDVVALSDGGVATSGTLRRRWTDAAGVERHHLVDPGTLLPADSGESILQVTVIAGTAAWAEALTKLVMVRGLAALAGLDEIGIAGRAVHADGRTTANATWELFAVAPAGSVT